jgi:hypothetical protein
MKPQCEKCNKELAIDGLAYVCSYECTFCEDCTTAMQNVCPNCKGELVRRPKRKIKSTTETDNNE